MRSLAGRVAGKQTIRWTRLVAALGVAWMGIQGGQGWAGLVEPVTDQQAVQDADLILVGQLSNIRPVEKSGYAWRVTLWEGILQMDKPFKGRLERPLKGRPEVQPIRLRFGRKLDAKIGGDVLPGNTVPSDPGTEAAANSPPGPDQTFSHLGLLFRPDPSQRIVASVAPSSPAADAKFQPKDVVHMIERQVVGTAREFQARLLAFPPGSRLNVVIERAATILTLQLLLPGQAAVAPSQNVRVVSRGPNGEVLEEVEYAAADEHGEGGVVRRATSYYLTGKKRSEFIQKNGVDATVQWTPTGEEYRRLKYVGVAQGQISPGPAEDWYLDAAGQRVNVDSTSKPGQKLYRLAERPFSGLLVSAYHPQGTVAQHDVIEQGKLVGSRLYYVTGSIQYEAHLNEHGGGTTIGWDPRGTKISEHRMEEGTPAVLWYWDGRGKKIILSGSQGDPLTKWEDGVLFTGVLPMYDVEGKPLDGPVYKDGKILKN